MGGTPTPDAQGCIPGGGQGSQPPHDYEAERQRQEAERQRQEEELRRQEEERQRREAEEAKRRQEEFDRAKRDVLRDMKGITQGELGLKGVETTDNLGLKGIGDTGAGGLGLKDVSSSASATRPKQPECQWGNLGSSVVDLRCLGLDPDKPITLDPHVVRGEERAFPAQPDPATFANVNYQKGFESLMKFGVEDAAAAVAYFQQAQRERPGDPLVRNGLLLAQDILKARQQKEKENRSSAAYFTLQSYAALMMGDAESARSYIAQARQLDPNNDGAKFIGSLATINWPEIAATPARRDAYKLVANSLVSIRERNYASAVAMLEAARRLQTGDSFIGTLLQEMRNYEAGRASPARSTVR